MKVFIRINDENIGPIDIGKIDQYEITKETPVWSEGLSEWTTAGEFEPLSGYFKSTPPEFVIQSSKNEVKNDKSSDKNSSRLILFLLLALLGIASIVAIIITNQNSSNQTSDYVKLDLSDNNSRGETSLDGNSEPAVDPITERNINIRNNWKDYITVNRSSYNYSKLGGISNLAIIVTNTTPYTISNVQVRVKILTVNGYVFRTKYLFFNDIKAKSKQQQFVPPTNRGVNVKYDIVSASSKGLRFRWSEDDHVGNGSVVDPWKYNF